MQDRRADSDDSQRHAYCSWCVRKSSHMLEKEQLIRRNIYKCMECKNPTVSCLGPGCENMARYEKRRKIFNAKWYCAEHRHEITDFSRQDEAIENLETAHKFYKEFRCYNLQKITRITVCTFGGAIVLGPFFYAAAYPIGGAIGGLTGLSGAAATSHGLALLGFGSLASGGFGMAGGVAVITAVGAGLGGAGGLAVGSAYASDIKNFEFKCIDKQPSGIAIAVNGFLSEASDTSEEWKAALKAAGREHDLYRLEWESQRLKKLGRMIGSAASREAFAALLKKAAKRASKKMFKRIVPPFLILDIFGFLKNPWSVALTKARMTSALLADVLARLRCPGLTIYAHSLGAAVVLDALACLGTRERTPVTKVHLTGAAYAIVSPEHWKLIEKGVNGPIHIYYSKKDWVLSLLYSVGKLFQETAIGCTGYPYADRLKNVHNHDVTDIVGSDHFGYIRNLPRFIADHSQLS